MKLNSAWGFAIVGSSSTGGDVDGAAETSPWPPSSRSPSSPSSSYGRLFMGGLLGGDRTDRALDLHYLHPWARHILTEEEACALIRPVTVDDVKTTMFDIEEDKHQGQMVFPRVFIKQSGLSWGRRSQGLSWISLLQAELFSGYNQCRLPPRCALKVDLRKAYDTVEWDFLFATLRMFGFPAVFIRWIEECVTSAHFSVVVNGGQFIDQDGQFLYHWRCTELKLFQLSFVDDLLLLCKADVWLVSLFRRGLDLFASLSGLHTLTPEEPIDYFQGGFWTQDSLLETLGFQEGHLPVRYLGLPLISARFSIADCQPLLQKIDSRIKGWEGVQLSFAGRVQLIKSVLVSLEVYWAMAFILPKGIIKAIIKKLRTFLWKGTSSSGYPKVAWEVVCRPIEEGGQGIKDIFALNRALMSKHLWAVIKQDRTSIWVDWILQVRLRDYSIWTVKENKGAWVGGKCSHLDIHCCLISTFELEMVLLSHFGMIRGTHLDLSSFDSPGDLS
ncbi:hypothetical protein Sango_3068200 [Sesamum angolense]|uniref:Reverse transcriptase domain-containing protein n=1 Tax=Sesamum angolense TaxID=2727404 RepID=A0AAE1TA99_9LAMI|nr:hypothetical protein Sango_3068200 [Sesamum angolense]